MTDPTPLPLSELERLEREATPGQWCALQNNGEVAGITLLLHPETQHDIAHLETPGRQDAGHNASLIAALRNNATALFAVVKAASELVHTAFLVEELGMPDGADVIAASKTVYDDLAAALQPLTEPEATDGRNE